MEAKQAVQGINAEFSEAFGRGDVAAIAALYLDDSSVLAPDLPTIRGKRAITESYKETIKNLGGKMTIKPVEIAAGDGWAYQWANYTVTGAKKSHAGKFVEIYSRQADGSWKIRLTIFNSDAPL